MSEPECGEARRHGTPAGYKRHQRAGEEPCGECASAHRVAQRSRDMDARAAAPLAILPSPAAVDDGSSLYQLERAKWALAAAEKAIAANAPGLAGLLREHSRLVDLVVHLEDARSQESVDRRVGRDERFDPQAI